MLNRHPKVRPCEVAGCNSYVMCEEPIAPVVCSRCALWVLLPLNTGVPLLRVLHGKDDIYYLSPVDDPLMLHAPLQRVRFEDGTIVTSQRLRCLGVAPALVQLPRVLVEHADPARDGIGAI